MISHVDYFKIGKADDIRKHGWVKVHLMGWEVVVMATDREFYAIEMGELASHAQKSFLPDDSTFSRSGAKTIINRLFLGPSGTMWGKLRYFPVRLEEDFVLVGVISRA